MGDDEEAIADGGLLHRRSLLIAGATSAAAIGAGSDRAAAESPDWMKAPGAPLSGYGSRAPSSNVIQRIVTRTTAFDGSGSSRTPLQLLEGTITPNGLHFERHHIGVPAIDPTRHELLIHGLVGRPPYAPTLFD